VCSLLLLVCEEDDELVFHIGELLCHSHVRDALQPTILPIIDQLELIYVFLWKLDPELHACMYMDNIPAFFALSWRITWFAHDVSDVAAVERWFDVFLASPNKLLPIYSAVALLLLKRDDILSALNRDSSISSLHSFLRSLPENSLFADPEHVFLEKWIEKTMVLSQTHPKSSFDIIAYKLICKSHRQSVMGFRRLFRRHSVAIAVAIAACAAVGVAIHLKA
jgi:hypothetical protein